MAVADSLALIGVKPNYMYMTVTVKQFYLPHPPPLSLSLSPLCHRPSKLSPLPDKLGKKLVSPMASVSPLVSPGVPKQPTFKKQYSKNKDAILLPHLPDAGVLFWNLVLPCCTGTHITSLSLSHSLDRHHAKALSHSPAVNGFGTLSSLGSNSQNGLTATGGNRGILLATIPSHQINSLEPFKGHGFRVSFTMQ